jgi:hypothetical protein
MVKVEVKTPKKTTREASDAFPEAENTSKNRFSEEKCVQASD